MRNPVIRVIQKNTGKSTAKPKQRSLTLSRRFLYAVGISKTATHPYQSHRNLVTLGRFLVASS